VVTNGSASASASWDGTYSTQPSTVACSGTAPSEAFNGVLNQAVPSSGLVVTGNSIPGPSGAIPIDSTGQAKLSYPVPSLPGSTLTEAFSFSRDAKGAATVSGSVDIAVVVAGTDFSEKCSLPLKGTRTTNSGSGSLPIVDPTIAKNDGMAYHRILNADMAPIYANQPNLQFRCDTPVNGGVTTCHVSPLTQFIHDSQTLLSDISSVPVPPGYELGDSRIRQGLKDQLTALAALGKGSSQADFEAGINAYGTAMAMIRNGIALLPP
jgi:hypothetical protein